MEPSKRRIYQIIKMPSIKISPLNIKAEKITSLAGMMKGFMFSRKPKNSLLFSMPREILADIHMIFVFFPLVIVWIDKNKRVTHFSRAKPFLFYQAHKAKYVLEIPYSDKVFKKLKKRMKLRF